MLNTLSCICSATTDGWLAFAGAIIGAIATIIAVIVTIKYEKKKDKEERIIASKPWISTEYELISDKDKLNEIASKNVLYVYQHKGNFVTSKKIPWELEDDEYRFNKYQCIVYYTFLNGGGNTATSVDVKINDKRFFSKFCITTNQEYKWVLVLPFKNNEEETRYKITFTYGDIVSETKYIQSETMIVKQDLNGVTLSQRLDDLINSPKEITEDNNNG